MPSSRQKLVKELDKAFSQFIRMRAADDDGLSPCFTCGEVKKWKEGDAGHFIGRSAYSVRWNEMNVQFQCKRCNIFQNGQQYLYSLGLDSMYGQGAAESLLKESKQLTKFSVDDLRDMVKQYKSKVEQLRADKGLE